MNRSRPFFLVRLIEGRIEQPRIFDKDCEVPTPHAGARGLPAARFAKAAENGSVKFAVIREDRGLDA